MSDYHESLLPIVNERRSGYVKLVRLLLFALAVLFSFHFIIFEPYLRVGTKLVETQESAEQYAALEANIEKRMAAYAKLEEELPQAVDRGIDLMMDNIAGDLEEVSELVRPKVREDIRGVSVSPGPVFDPRIQRRRSMVMQEEASVMPRGLSQVAATFQVPKTVEPKLKSANDWGEVRWILKPEVEKQIIDVRFSEYNAELKKTVDDSVKSIESANAWEPKNLEVLPESLRTLWRTVDEASEKAVETVKQIQAKPPADDSWWFTQDGKAAAGEYELKRTTQVVTQIKDQVGYDKVLASLQAQLEALSSTESVVEAERAELEKKFASFHEKLGQLLGPLDWLPLNVDDLVYLMPFLVACVLGGGVGWVMLRRRSYRRLLDACLAKSESVRELGFTLELENSTGSVRTFVIGGAVLAVAWIAYGNMRVRALDTLRQGTGNDALLGDVGYSALLNWGVSLVLLAAGIFQAWIALKERKQV